jgi:DNA-binding NarL/FixJ family response regulator
MLRVAIVDDHRLFVDGLVNFIKDDHDLQLCFIATNAAGLRKELVSQAIDLLLLDVNLPPENGLLLLPEFKQQYPNMKVLIISMYQPVDIQLNLSQFRGDAYVLKTSGQEVLEQALSCIKAGQSFIDPNIRDREQSQDLFTQQLKLTRREKEIITLIAAGKNNKEIAAHLFLSELTIQTHRRNISEKIGAKGMAALIHKSIQFEKGA